MRDFKSIRFDLSIPIIYLVFFLKLTQNLSDFSFILEHLYLTIIISIFFLSFTFNTVTVNQLGISKSYLGILKYKQKTWRDIKFYVTKFTQAGMQTQQKAFGLLIEMTRFV